MLDPVCCESIVGRAGLLGWSLHCIAAAGRWALCALVVIVDLLSAQAAGPVLRTQTLTFALPVSASLSSGSLPLVASTSSGLPLSYAVVSGPGSVSGDRLVLAGQGAVTVRVEQAGNAEYRPVRLEKTVAVQGFDPVITWLEPAEDAPIDNPEGHRLVATSNFGMPVGFRVVSGSATVQGDRLIPTGDGMVTVEASQEGDAQHAPGVRSRTFFARRSKSNDHFADAWLLTGEPSESISSNVDATMEPGEPGEPVYNGEISTRSLWWKWTPTKTGNVFIRVTSQGFKPELNIYTGSGLSQLQVVSQHDSVRNQRYHSFRIECHAGVMYHLSVRDAEGSGSGRVTLGVGVPFLYFQEIQGQSPSRGIPGDTFPLTKSASSGLRIAYRSSDTSVFTVSGNLLTMVGSGEAVLTADQAGDHRFSRAQTVSSSVRVDVPPVAQAITFPKLPPIPIAGVPLWPGAYSTASLPISYRSADPQVLKVENGFLVGVKTGTAIITASQLGNARFVPAEEVHQAVEVVQHPQSLVWITPDLDSIIPVGRAVSVGVRSTSGLPVTVRWVSGPGVLTGDQLHVTGVGTIVLEASQPGNETYEPTTSQRLVNRGRTILDHKGESSVGGYTSHVFIAGSTAYLAMEDRGVWIVDITRPDQPVRIGEFSTGMEARSVYVTGGLAFVTVTEGEMRIFDVRNPARPVELGQTRKSGSIFVQVVGNLAYVDGWLGSEGLNIFDVSNPTRPLQLGTVPCDGLRGGVVVGKMAYLAEGAAGLAIHDVSNPTNSVLLGRVPTYGRALSVRVVGTRAYVADGDAGMMIMDVSDPTVPTALGRIKTFGKCVDLQVDGALVYLAINNVGIQVVDVSDPARIRYVRDLGLSRSPRNLQLSGGYAFVADVYLGMLVYDLQPTANDQRVGPLLGTCCSEAIGVDGEVAFVAHSDTGLLTLDVSDASAPKVVSSFASSFYAPFRGRQLLAVENGIVCLAQEAEKWQILILDVQESLRPTVLSRIIPSGPVNRIQISQGFLYVAASGNEGFSIFDLRDPTDPQLVAQVNTGGWTRGVHVVGDVAFVADGLSGLRIYDLTQRSTPILMSTLPGKAASVEVVGSLAYVRDADKGLEVVEVLDPRSPTVRGRLPLGARANKLRIFGQTVFVSTYDESGFDVYDVSDPSLIRLEGRVMTRGVPEDLQVIGSKVYVAEGNEGVHLYELIRDRFAQTLTLEVPSTVELGAGPMVPTISASSGLPPVLSVVDGPAAMDGVQIVPTGVGTVTIEVVQSGNEQFLPARLQRKISVNLTKRERISGQVRYFAGTNAVPGVILASSREPSRFAQSDIDGHYTLELDQGFGYSVGGTKIVDSPPAAGVTTLDILLMRRRTLGIAHLDSPFQFLAADVNRSGSITALDILFIRRLILGISTNLPGGPWLFVPSSPLPSFGNPPNAFSWSNPETLRYFPFLDAPWTGQDFIGIKLGDVNGSWTPPSTTPPPPEAQSMSDEGTGSFTADRAGSQASTSRSLRLPGLQPDAAGARVNGGGILRLSLGEGEINGSGELEVPVRVSGSQRVHGMQFSVEWNPALFEWVRTGGNGLPGFNEGNMNALEVSSGRLSVAWDDVEGFGVDVSEAGVSAGNTTAQRLEIVLGSSPGNNPGSNPGSADIPVGSGRRFASPASGPGREVMRLTFRPKATKPSAGLIRFAQVPTPVEVVTGDEVASTQTQNTMVWLGRSPMDSAMRLPGLGAASGSGGSELRVPTWVGVTSVIETTQDLGAKDWREVGRIVGDGTVAGWPVTVLDRGQGYYRVRWEP